MKNNQTKLKSILIWVALALFTASGCGGDDGPTPEQLRLNELTASWTLSSVINDGTDVSSQFGGFVLVVSGNQTYSTTNGGNAWPAQGTFQLLNDNLDAFLRDDNVQVNINAISEITLVLSFQITSVGGAANGVAGITGSFTFNLNKTN